MSKTSFLYVHLDPHPTARTRAVTSTSLPQGTSVMSTAPLSTVLIESEKGRRCDSCLRARMDLHRCTGCKKYWYCDSMCQMISWKAHHRRLCKRLLVFTASPAYEDLSSPERLHSLLLAHLLAEHAAALLSACRNQTSRPDDLSDPIFTLLSLLPQKDYKHVVPTVLTGAGIPDSLIECLSSRFANNNFTIHSARMDVFAHGVFPFASRSFNHSCAPSAVPVYSVGSSSVRMDVRLVHDMEAGEEITIPYTDPALPYATRQRDLEFIYNFTCTCALCQLRLPPSPPPPFSPQELALFETRLRRNILPFLRRHDSVPSKLREEFLPIFQPSYLPSLAELFSQTSHNGPYGVAVQKGATLLAVYCLLYPTNYPMIALQSLELAKTCWNGFVTEYQMSPGQQREWRCSHCNAGFTHKDDLKNHVLKKMCQNGSWIDLPGPTEILQDMEIYLNVTARIFSVLFGDTTEAGDEDGGPIAEARLLQEMLKAEEDHAS